MQTTIAQKIQQIEQEEQITIIHAVESGSRAWGFPSPDSDYDVRFFYIRPLSFYLALEKTRDVIEWQLDETLDINGWDLQKALRLLHSSNPTLFEWSQSPIVYKTTPQFAQMQQVMNDYFSNKAGVHHYLSTAYTNYTSNISKYSQIKPKKYFYVLRPLLACHWILNQNTPPPMVFHQLVEAYLDNDLKPLVNELLHHKMKTSELAPAPRISQLDHYIEKQLTQLKTIADNLPPAPKKSWQTLNALFCQLIGLNV